MACFIFQQDSSSLQLQYQTTNTSTSESKTNSLPQNSFSDDSSSFPAMISSIDTAESCTSLLSSATCDEIESVPVNIFSGYDEVESPTVRMKNKESVGSSPLFIGMPSLDFSFPFEFVDDSESLLGMLKKKLMMRRYDAMLEETNPCV